MISIKANFIKIKNKNSNLGTYPCLCKVIKYKRFSRKSLVKAFNDLIQKDEYCKNEKKKLIDYLESQTNIVEEGEISKKNALTKD